jgi:hypothetical protein
MPKTLKDAANDFVRVIEKRHYGRMPDEVQQSLNALKDALDEHGKSCLIDGCYYGTATAPNCLRCGGSRPDTDSLLGKSPLDALLHSSEGPHDSEPRLKQNHERLISASPILPRAAEGRETPDLQEAKDAIVHDWFTGDFSKADLEARLDALIEAAHGPAEPR